MDHFQYRKAVLHCESIPVESLAKEYGTPLYVYSAATLRDHFVRFKAAFSALSPTICFSVKSCHNLSILRLLKSLGASFDVVSGGELSRVIEAGGDPSQVAFAGVGKSDEEIRAGLEIGIGWFNAESEAELSRIGSIAEALGKTARVALRINPDVDPETHVYTTTGKRETKFGVDLDRAESVFSAYGGHKCLNLCGIHIHLGSPVNKVEPYVVAIHRGLGLIDRLHDKGREIEAINLGGGFGAHYEGTEAPTAEVYAAKIVPLLVNRGLRVSLEPGRCIAANAGVLLTKVRYLKKSGDRRFVIVDAAITELVRPALYGSFHFAWPVNPVDGMAPPVRSASLHMKGSQRVDLVGPVCESGDFLAKDRWLPELLEDDLICLFGTGAYGFVMSSQYNSRPRAAEVMVEGEQARLIRRRETYEDLVRAERLPET